jgi:trans-aconitate methyltransferase
MTYEHEIRDEWLVPKIIYWDTPCPLKGFDFAMTDKIDKQQMINDYLNGLEMKDCRTNEEYWEQLDSHNTGILLDMLDQAMQDRYEGDISDAEFYDIKNKTLRLSLDVSNYSYDLYRKYFEWLINSHIEAPQKILDLGCDNGVVTCFLAKLFPGSEVVGIDVLEKGITCAKELAEKLGLTNVSFLQTDVKDLQEHFPKNSFDLITAFAVFHEAMEGSSEQPTPWSTEELLKTDLPEYDTNGLLNLVHDLLKDDTSEFITCDRLPGMNSVSLWARLLKEAGLHVDFARSEFIHFHEMGVEQQMPLFTSSKKDMGTNLLKGIYELYKVDEQQTHTQSSDALAEITFYDLENKEFVMGTHITFTDGSGEMRNELWTTDIQLIYYQLSNQGYRQLYLLPLENLPQAKVDLLQMKDQYLDQIFIPYDSIDARERI